MSLSQSRRPRSGTKRGRRPLRSSRCHRRLEIVATVFGDTEGILLADDKGKGVTVSGEDCSSLLKSWRNLEGEEKRKRDHSSAAFARRRARAQGGAAVAAPHDRGFQTPRHPPCIPDLAPCGFCLCPDRDSFEAGHVQVMERLTLQFEGKNDILFPKSIDQLIERCEKCGRF